MKDNIELLSKEIYKDGIEYPLIVRYFARILDDKLPVKFKLHLSYYFPHLFRNVHNLKLLL